MYFKVKDEPIPIPVHKQAACVHSPVFHAAFNSNLVEGLTQTYCLDDVELSTFKLLVQYLYSEKPHLSQLELTGIYDVDIAASEDAELARLWILADRL